MPLLPLDPPCLIVPVRGCGFTPAPPAGTGKHSQDHMLCSTHLTFLASQLCPLLCFTCSFFPATFCLFTVSPWHTGLLQAFPQWQWLGVLLFWWDSLAATVPGGGTPLLEWDVPHPKSLWVCTVPEAAASGTQTAGQRLSILLGGCLSGVLQVTHSSLGAGWKWQLADQGSSHPLPPFHTKTWRTCSEYIGKRASCKVATLPLGSEFLNQKTLSGGLKGMYCVFIQNSKIIL